MEHPKVGTTLNVQATHVQVALGDHSRQRMSVRSTSDEVAERIDRVVETLQAFNLIAGHELELAEAQRAALQDLKGEEPTTAGVRRFCDWATSVVRRGGTAAAITAVTAVSDELFRDAETLVHSLGG